MFQSCGSSTTDSCFYQAMFMLLFVCTLFYFHNINNITICYMNSTYFVPNGIITVPCNSTFCKDRL